MKNAKRVFMLCGLLSFSTVSEAFVEKLIWPALPTSDFIAGRPATMDDARQGRAVFSLSDKGRGALPIAIPQYVLWTDDHGEKHPMILVQAEIAPDGTKIVGLRDFKNGETVATLAEVKLLGTRKPN